MKHIITFVAALIVCATMIANPVSRETARQVAVNFWKTTERGLASQEEPVFVEISAELGLQGFYVFTTAENDGFVIVSAEDAMTPILGYSTRNGFVENSGLPVNLSCWLRNYTQEAEAVREHSLEADESTSRKWENLVSGTYQPTAAGTKTSHLLNIPIWGPKEPCNNLCPLWHDTLTRVGCAAVAMAQVMRYHKWPVTGTGSHSYQSRTHRFTCEADFGSTTYDWDNMPSGGADAPISTWNETQKNAVATLMYHCGVSVDMDYNLGTSWARMDDVLPALTTYFNYPDNIQYCKKNDYENDEWITMLKKEIDENRPIIYEGPGHAFVCDGYDTENNFHFNMGWHGAGDGFFALTSIIPNVSWGTNLSNNQKAHIGISSPNNAIDNTESCKVRLYPNPTNGMLHVNGEGVQKIEVIDAVGRAVITQTDGNLVDMSALNKSIYTVRITAKGGTFVRKVAKQ